MSIDKLSTDTSKGYLITDLEIGCATDNRLLLGA